MRIPICGPLPECFTSPGSHAGCCSPARRYNRGCLVLWHAPHSVPSHSGRGQDGQCSPVSLATLRSLWKLRGMQETLLCSLLDVPLAFCGSVPYPAVAEGRGWSTVGCCGIEEQTFQEVLQRYSLFFKCFFGTAHLYIHCLECFKYYICPRPESPNHF